MRAIIDPRQSWRTKEGTYLPVSEMDDRHLLNSAQMMSRNLERAMRKMMAVAADPTLINPDTGELYDDEDREEIRQTAERCRDKLDMLDAEALRRWSI